MIDINDLNEEEQIKFIKDSYYWCESVVDIKNPSERVLKEAIRKNIAYITAIDDPSEELQLEVIRNIKYKFDKYNQEVHYQWIEYWIKSPKALELYKRLKKVRQIIK
jgi:hypothetical protein